MTRQKEVRIKMCKTWFGRAAGCCGQGFGLAAKHLLTTQALVQKKESPLPVRRRKTANKQPRRKSIPVDDLLFVPILNLSIFLFFFEGKLLLEYIPSYDSYQHPVFRVRSRRHQRGGILRVVSIRPVISTLPLLAVHYVHHIFFVFQRTVSLSSNTLFSTVIAQLVPTPRRSMQPC